MRLETGPICGSNVVSAVGRTTGAVTLRKCCGTSRRRGLVAVKTRISPAATSRARSSSAARLANCVTAPARSAPSCWRAVAQAPVSAFLGTPGLEVLQIDEDPLRHLPG